MDHRPRVWLAQRSACGPGVNAPVCKFCPTFVPRRYLIVLFERGGGVSRLARGVLPSSEALYTTLDGTHLRDRLDNPALQHVCLCLVMFSSLRCFWRFMDGVCPCFHARDCLRLPKLSFSFCAATSRLASTLQLRGWHDLLYVAVGFLRRYL